MSARTRGVAASAVGAAVAGGAVGFRRWQRGCGERLVSGSEVLDLPSGPLELHDSGPGAGVPVLVIHGSPGGYDQARVVATGLGLSGARVLAPSRPGYLRTPLSSGPTPAEQADLFAELLDHLGIESLAIIAVSGGGPIALEFALRHSDRCDALVMIETLVQTFTDREMYAALSPVGRVGKWLGERAAESDPVIATYLAVTPRSDPARDVAASSVRFDLRRAGYAADTRVFDHVPDYPVERITQPVLVIHGTKDTDVPFRQSEQLARRAPNARLLAIDGADHLSLWRAPEVGAAVREFLHSRAVTG